MLKGLSLAELRGMVHRLGGGIGMLGYLEFSHWCRTQEEALLGSDAPDTTGITTTSWCWTMPSTASQASIC